jgi:hypothetical protein
MRAFWGLLSEALHEWVEDKVPQLGAALAYYAAFSIAPLLILLVAMVGLFFKGNTLSQVQTQIAELAGETAAEAIVAIIRGVESSGSGRAATVVSVVTLIIGATGMFGQLQDAMNTIWKVTPKATPHLDGCFPRPPSLVCPRFGDRPPSSRVGVLERISSGREPLFSAYVPDNRTDMAIRRLWIFDCDYNDALCSDLQNFAGRLHCVARRVAGRGSDGCLICDRKDRYRSLPGPK